MVLEEPEGAFVVRVGRVPAHLAEQVRHGSALPGWVDRAEPRFAVALRVAGALQQDAPLVAVEGCFVAVADSAVAGKDDRVAAVQFSADHAVT
ncbi:hypothetical protein [Saccharothrix syringae]|uniref:Uncharacterized protein n=1 Tax=Saccharothrix syringae TaxID=103733 RepID=A0A5Q0GTS8_SACSY|nr:hypothetical protein [Saccharothrix syringae]QFZ16782.1 hypothetical protein EKG83_04250 [Saccharothrix syringae]